MIEDPTPQYFSRSTDEFGGKIPFIVTDLIAKLRSMKAENVEGIFRLSGAALEISNLSLLLDQGRVTDWSSFPNVHTISCTLKKYFRDNVRQKPLLPFEYFESFIAIPNEIQTDEEAIPKYKEILQKISKPRLLTFAFLIRYLYEISLIESSKMNAHNLAIVIAPNLLAPKPGTRSPDEEIQLNALQNNAIELMIRLSNQIFDDVQIQESDFISDEDFTFISSPPISDYDIPIINEIINIRKKSLIPYVPSHMQNNENNNSNKE